MADTLNLVARYGLSVGFSFPVTLRRPTTGAFVITSLGPGANDITFEVRSPGYKPEIRRTWRSWLRHCENMLYTAAKPAPVLSPEVAREFVHQHPILFADLLCIEPRILNAWWPYALDPLVTAHPDVFTPAIQALPLNELEQHIPDLATYLASSTATLANGRHVLTLIDATLASVSLDNAFSQAPAARQTPKRGTRPVVRLEHSLVRVPAPIEKFDPAKWHATNAALKVVNHLDPYGLTPKVVTNLVSDPALAANVTLVHHLSRLSVLPLSEVWERVLANNVPFEFLLKELASGFWTGPAGHGNTYESYPEQLLAFLKAHQAPTAINFSRFKPAIQEAELATLLAAYPPSALKVSNFSGVAQATLRAAKQKAKLGRALGTKPARSAKPLRRQAAAI